jgi:hypothetical protein
MTLSRITAALHRGLAKVDQFAGELVTYERGSATVQIRGTRGDRTALESATNNETTIQTDRVDWIFRASAMDLEAGPIEPAEGDVIIDSAGVKYRVTKHPNDGKPARWMEHRVAMRVHTVVVS